MCLSVWAYFGPACLPAKLWALRTKIGNSQPRVANSWLLCLQAKDIASKIFSEMLSEVPRRSCSLIQKGRNIAEKFSETFPFCSYPRSDMLTYRSVIFLKGGKTHRYRYRSVIIMLPIPIRPLPPGYSLSKSTALYFLGIKDWKLTDTDTDM